jgi:hypothetical protein
MMGSCMTSVVFSGPTLPAAEVTTRIGAICLPPARQGDLWRAVRELRPAAIGLIDGRFLDVPSVWHREILAALTEGVHVFGAASMGALRAAELDSFGMHGVGQIYTAYRDGVWPDLDDVFADDDEVAVIHSPIESGAIPLSDAMVDLRATLAAAAAAGVIDSEASRSLASVMKHLHFPERSFQRMVALAPSVIGASDAARLTAWLPSGRISQKRCDAIEMLDVMADFLASWPQPFVPEFTFSRALVWERFVANDAARLTADETLVLEELRIHPETWRSAARVGLGRLHSLRAAAPPEGDAVRAEMDRFRHERGLGRWRDIETWMEANAIDAAGLVRLLNEDAALESLGAAEPPEWKVRLLDHLRLSGHFAPLLTRARAKARMFANGTRPTSLLELQVALDWYAETRLGRKLPDWPEGHVPHTGFASEADFASAVWREYIFSRAEEQ